MAQGDKHTIAMGNITRVIPLDFNDRSSPYIQDGNFVDENGFFIRAATAGVIKYCPVGNKSDAEAITKDFEASNKFVDPEMCRKVFNLGVVSPPQAEDIYIGYGV